MLDTGLLIGKMLTGLSAQPWAQHSAQPLGGLME